MDYLPGDGMTKDEFNKRCANANELIDSGVEELRELIEIAIENEAEFDKALNRIKLGRINIESEMYKLKTQNQFLSIALLLSVILAAIGFAI